MFFLDKNNCVNGKRFLFIYFFSGSSFAKKGAVMESGQESISFGAPQKRSLPPISSPESVDNY